MPSSSSDQLRAEPRERQAVAALDDQLDDVARQYEAEREQHREVGGGQRVENDLGQEVRRQLRRSIGQTDHRDQRREQQADQNEDESGIVAEGAARRAWCRGGDGGGP